MLSEFFDFSLANPFLGFVVICAIYYTLKWVFRCINIAARGWPPAHLDADGDFHSDKKSDPE